MPGWARAGRRAGLCLGLALSWAAAVGAAEADPLAFLRQVQAAARTLDYAGVTVYQQGRMLQATHLVHQVDGTGERERQEVLDGSPQECLRQNGMEQCLLPEHRLIVMRPAHSDHFPALLLGEGEAVPRHYEWTPLGRTYRVAGRECAVSELRARDALRYSYRICTDLQNHLLLKSQTLDAEGRLVDQVAFSSIHFGADIPPGALASRWNTRDWRLRTETSRPANLAAQGWRFAPPAGFQPIAELTRQMGAGHAVDQLVLSDGLAAISIFIETFDPKRDQSIRQGGLRQGAISIYRMRLASYWLTAVGEVPAQTVHDLAHAVQYLPQAAH
ncbi:MucB/RseB C-terminal domain-containing protein [Castellaniella defragrans]|uniref:Sigma-E factor negative regulatory protein RseB n=1 Tax=Castellaniella defragrans TaxID=75697 RepID=A0A7W9TQF1_CASDE|nr:MucB/RseB C-terminal domain-containing protein [Castellaniella defragrans]KAB0605612.1 siderophore-interacting protein [Castellaniella defragrans]MBB6084983.1 sigma-E factor negative regulatory protein RseB [Castellaniella defragrans]